MSGHSKWANIRVRKGSQDARRGKIFTRHAKLIAIAAREGGGGDPETNARLRTAIDDARMENVPNANIERAVKKGLGELKDGVQTVSVLYEAYGPAAGSAFLIECLTDNRNRAFSNVKLAVAKNGGRLAASGSVAWMFEQKGVVRARGACDEALELTLIDAGADDIDVADGIITVMTGREKWPAVRDILKTNGHEIETAGLAYIPKQTVRIPDKETANMILRLIDALEEEDDVHEVHTNAVIISYR